MPDNGSADHGSVDKMITAREANQGFSELLREAEAGQSFVITRRGEPVARLVPYRHRRDLTPEQEAALERTRRRAAQALEFQGWAGRDELYEERIGKLVRRRRGE